MNYVRPVTVQLDPAFVDRLTAVLDKLEQRAALEASATAPRVPLGEPTGLGAVVRDDINQLWIRVGNEGPERWYSPPFRKGWASIIRPEILSLGVDL